MARAWQWQSVMAGAGVFLSSYDMGLMSMALVSLKHSWLLSGWELSAVASITSVGMVIGSLAGGVLADRYGRRGVLAWDYLCFLGAAAVSALSPNVWWLLFARLVVGFGVGADFSISFAFLAEVCPVARRGRVMAWVMWLANFGTVLAYGVGSWFLAAGGPEGWRWTLATGAALAVPLLLVRSRVAESPRWMRARAHHSYRLRDMVRYFARPAIRRALTVAQGSYFCYQITDQGLGVFLPLVLVSLLGTTVSTAAWASVVVKGITIPAALCTVWLIDRWGRRPLQLLGFLGRALALLMLGGLYLARWAPPGAVLGGLMIAVYFFGSAGPDKTTVIAPAEQFATFWRATGEGLSEMAGRMGGVVGIAGYGVASTLWGVGGGLLLFALASVLGTILSLGLRETRPKNLPGGRLPAAASP